MKYCAVGNHINKNKNLIIVSCHRIVCSDRKIVGYIDGVMKE